MNMLLSDSFWPPKNDDTASFNDDSSPDTRLTANRKVSINAQVPRDGSLEWFYKLANYCSDISGELKAPDAWIRFQRFYPDDKRQIWSTLSKMRIHIVDPRPHEDRVYGCLRRSWRNHDAPKILRQRVIEGCPLAKSLSGQLETFIATSILSDSTATRVYDLARLFGVDFFLLGALSESESPLIEPDDLGANTKALVWQATQWSVKSAAAFHAAIDAFMEMSDEDAANGQYSEQLIRIKMSERVLDGHAFDAGNDHHIRLLEEARETIVQRFERLNGCHLSHLRCEYSQLDSRGSYFIQAADIAAGFASRIFQAEGLRGVVSRFEYVTYNGEGMSHSAAEQEKYAEGAGAS